MVGVGDVLALSPGTWRSRGAPPHVSAPQQEDARLPPAKLYEKSCSSDGSYSLLHLHHGFPVCPVASVPCGSRILL